MMPTQQNKEATNHLQQVQTPTSDLPLPTAGALKRRSTEGNKLEVNYKNAILKKKKTFQRSR